jgi:hypothetical protein
VGNFQLALRNYKVGRAMNTFDPVEEEMKVRNLVAHKLGIKSS